MTRDIDTVRLVAHELRAPLAVIKGYLALICDGTFPVPDETRRGAVDVMAAKARELDHLIEHWLASATPGGEHQRAEIADLDARASVREAVARLRPRASLEKAGVYYSLPRREVMVRAHPAHVSRILDNLLNNALDHSSAPAKVVVEIRDGSPVEVVVRDWGNGIPEGQRDAVFLPFVRAGSSGRSGFGLGLAISRELAVRNRGTLILDESTVGRGSTFILRLPRAAAGP